MDAVRAVYRHCRSGTPTGDAPEDHRQLRSLYQSRREQDPNFKEVSLFYLLFVNIFYSTPHYNKVCKI